MSYADWREAYEEDIERHKPTSPTYHLEMHHWHKTPAPRKRDLALKGRLHPPCSCGKPYFSTGLCRPCYFKSYNKTRIRRKAA